MPTDGSINTTDPHNSVRDTLNDANLLDRCDRLILSAMHEFEYDPFRGHDGPRPRLSPVPLYLIYAATTPLSEQRMDGRRWPMIEVDVHARVEALKTLGFVRDGDRNWQAFDCRAMRGGRFIHVESEPGIVPRRGESMPEDTTPQTLFREYRIHFGDLSEFEAAMASAWHSDPDGDSCVIFESVMCTFPKMSWRYYDEASRKQLSDEIGIPLPEHLSDYALCYALTPSGIAAARATINWIDIDGGDGSDVAPAQETDTSSTPPRADGFYPPRTAVWHGQEHDCDLTEAQMAFLSVGLTDREVEISQLMNSKNGLVWTVLYRNDRATRDKISQFLSRLNARLSQARPPLGVSFSLRRSADSISREEQATPSHPAVH